MIVVTFGRLPVLPKRPSVQWPVVERSTLSDTIRFGRTYLFRDYFVIPVGTKPHARGQQVLFHRVDRHDIDTAARGDFVLHAQLQPPRY